ncbi:uncharacterized protein [Watersipora subatra]|uniref:uncharacterized protein n=1 Tax=Watersipora subatra TaxID=2589382 RepID=UPI00355C75E4
MAKDLHGKVITRSEYNGIISFIDSCPPRQSFKRLQTQYPQIDSWTLWSIDNRHYTNKMKKNTILLKSEKKFLNQIYMPYMESSPVDSSALLRIADSVDISPALVAKRLLEHEFSNLVGGERPRSSTTSVDASTFPQKRVQQTKKDSGPGLSGSVRRDLKSNPDRAELSSKMTNRNCQTDTLTAGIHTDSHHHDFRPPAMSVTNKQQCSNLPPAAEFTDIYNMNNLNDLLNATEVSQTTSAEDVSKIAFTKHPKCNGQIPSSQYLQPLQLLSEYALRDQIKLNWILRHDSNVEESCRHMAELFVVIGSSSFSYKASGLTSRHARERCALQILHRLQGGGDCIQSSGSSNTDVKAEVCPGEPPVHESNGTQKKEAEKTNPDCSKQSNSGKKMISRWLREPHLIPDARLSQQVRVCTANDTQYGPVAMALHANIGSEYEFKLIEEAKRHNLCYQDEHILRTKGYDKTPDIKLTVPIAVEGNVVNWIESKASYGDEATHEKYLQDQLWSYWNRFGPGLVIYWFGYSSEIVDKTAGSILIGCQFPSAFTTMDCLKAKVA